MHLGLRLLFAFVAITGLAAFFVLRVFVTEIKPSVREVMEDLMVDTANLLAEVAVAELARLPAGAAVPGDGALAAAVRHYRERSVDVRIWGLHKTTLDLRVVLTDAAGRVVFDSGTPSAVGEDYSRWRDVTLTLRGEYGARMSPESADANASPVMFVASPVKQGDRTLGALVLAKPMSTIAPFIERAERKVLLAGVLLLGLSLAIGVGVTWWVVRSVRQLRQYALLAGDTDGPRPPPWTPPTPPALPGELGELAQAMGQMRQRLEGREQLEQQVRALTHELKSPLAAIQGAAELLQEPLSAADQQRFALQVGEQAGRLHALVRQMLELSKVESLQAPPAAQRIDWAQLTDEVLAEHRPALEQRGLRALWRQRASGLTVRADPALLRLAVSNVLANALQHAPAGSALELGLEPLPGGALQWSLRDHGPGVPAFALARLGERFYTAPAEGGTRGSGLGLAIVRRVLWLHGGDLRFEDAAPGLRVLMQLPADRG
jgi:two-component system sensor histidine kinase CreC